jgi:hypothetical protein
MTRDAQIPLFLWIATAVVVHALWGGGADRAAKVIEEKIEIREFAASVRRFVRGENKPIEIALLDEANEPKPPEPTAKPEDDKTEPEQPDEKKSADKDEAKPEKPKTPLPEPKKEPEEKKKPEDKKPEEKKAEEKKAVEATPEPEPPAAQEKRVAVKQHADPNQADNPNAHFIADEANHVEEEQRARITSTDQDDPKPTVGGAAQSSKDPNDPGDSDENKILQSDDHKGVHDKAPAEHASAPSPKVAQEPAHNAPSTAAAEAHRDGAQGAPKSESASKLPPEAGQAPRPALHAAEEMPETVDSTHGGWEIAGQKAGATEQTGRQARKRRELPPMRVQGLGGLLGLGATGTTPGGMNLNLTPQVAIAAIGEDTLKRERVADGERRRSQHAGHWRPSGIERWRSAIENYVPSVKPGNQTALNTAAVPFASYLNQIHSRIHPIFADTFLASLDQLPASDPMNRPEIFTVLEIAVDHEDGHIQRMGVTRTSGVTAFDVAALDSVSRAQPFGTPPQQIVSPDGNVYLHWEFHRGVEACGTANAHPYMLKVQPKTAPTPSEPATPPETNEPERHGEAAPPQPSEGKSRASRPPPAFAKTLE